jgi:hypothetical protein
VSERSLPGGAWLVSVLIAAVLAGGVATVVSDRTAKAPIVDRVVRTKVVLPEGQAEVQGTVDGFKADDANGPKLSVPLEIEHGGATIEDALVGGQRSTIVWDGGRPLRLRGTGAIDLGPTHVEMGAGAIFWPIDGLRVLDAGSYRVDTPVAVGTGGLARPRDSVDFTADDNTTIDTTGGATVLRGIDALHLEGPGSIAIDGSFTIRTREGTVTRTHLEFGPGPFVFDLAPDRTFTATFNGPLTST